MNIRIGQGFDAHRFELQMNQSPLILGGVAVPYTHGLEAHSDGDVIVHALCDALLGAAGLPDIGHFFPDSDPKFKNVDSILLLQEVAKTIEDKGWKVGNVDITVIAQMPKLSPYIENMKARLSSSMKTGKENIAVKATTTEKMGFTGRGEGIATLAVVLLFQNTNIN